MECPFGRVSLTDHLLDRLTVPPSYLLIQRDLPAKSACAFVPLSGNRGPACAVTVEAAPREGHISSHCHCPPRATRRQDVASDYYG